MNKKTNKKNRQMIEIEIREWIKTNKIEISKRIKKLTNK